MQARSLTKNLKAPLNIDEASFVSCACENEICILFQFFVAMMLLLIVIGIIGLYVSGIMLLYIIGKLDIK